MIGDPDGVLINLYTPVTPKAQQLQQNRTPKLLPPTPQSALALASVTARVA